MKITAKMQNELNKQINRELFSEYLYLSMSAYFESLNFKGFAHWMKMQAVEEHVHAMKIFDYLFERGGSVTLDSIKKPQGKWKSPLDAFKAAYGHEQEITMWIGRLKDAAANAKDHATDVFLDWFVKEQVEEEEQSREIVEKLKSIGDSKPALFMLDSILGKRKE